MTQPPPDLSAIAATGVPLARVGQGLTALGRAGGRLPAVQPCDTCGQPATTQTQRAATDSEATTHWDALEANIRSSNSGKPEAEYVIDRTRPVMKAAFWCDQHKPTPVDTEPASTTT